MIMGTLESDWLKVSKNPEMYQAALESLLESQAEGEVMNMNFFR